MSRTDAQPDLSAVSRLLARHAERRRQGIATVSVLAGPEPFAAWAMYAGPAGVRVDATAATGTASLLDACLVGIARAVPLLTLAVADIGRRIGRPPAEVLAGRSTADLEQLWPVVPTDGTDDDRDAVTAARLVCTVPTDRWSTALTAALPGWRPLAAVGRLFVGRPLPPLWVSGGDGSWLAAAAGPLASLAAAVPAWPLGVGVLGGGVRRLPSDGRVGPGRNAAGRRVGAGVGRRDA